MRIFALRHLSVRKVINHAGKNEDTIRKSNFFWGHPRKTKINPRCPNHDLSPKHVTFTITSVACTASEALRAFLTGNR